MDKRYIQLNGNLDQYPEIILSAGRNPVKAPGEKSKHILVIGGGVSGLMTAWILLDKGYRVTILSKEWAWPKGREGSRITSQIAGALWEFPPGGCGLTEISDQGPEWASLDHHREWALQSYEFYTKLHNLEHGKYKGEFGVSITKLNQFFYHPLTPSSPLSSEEHEKLEAIRRLSEKKRIDGLIEWDQAGLSTIFKELGVGQKWQQSLKAGYTHNSPVINTDKAMVFLMTLVKNKGADFETRVVVGRLTDVGPALLENYNAAAIINATGLGARELADDRDVFPVRGATKQINNNDSDKFEHLNQAYLIPVQKQPNAQPTQAIFLVPRNDETLVVGSIIQKDNDQLNLSSDSPEVEIMWKRARSFLPSLNDTGARAEYPLAQGLRPFTTRNVKVRVDETAQFPLIHNYGHGGSGWTLAVGCARSAVHLLESFLNMKSAGNNARIVNRSLYPAKKLYKL